MSKIEENTPVSFSNALEQVQKLEVKRESSWMGKKVYLAYSETEGWKIKELNLFDRVLRGLKLAHRDTHLSNVFNALNDKLTLEDALKIGDSGLLHKMPKLKDGLERIIDRLLSNPPEGSIAPKEVSITLMEDNQIVNPVQGNKIDDETNVPKAFAPLSLINYSDRERSISPSRCYTDSVLEMMLSQDSLREQIFNVKKTIDAEIGEVKLLMDAIDMDAIDSESELNGDEVEPEERVNLLANLQTLEKKARLINALIEVIQSAGPIALKESEPKTDRTAPAEKVREAIFDSELNGELRHEEVVGEGRIANLYQQQDAAAVMELFMDQILNNSIQTAYVDVVTDENKTYEIQRPITTETALQIPVEKGKINVLNEAIAAFMGLKEINDARKFNIEGEEKKFETYSTKTTFESLPAHLCVHLNRYDNSGEKLTDPVKLPEDGVIDLSNYYSGNESGKQKYEITGYVMHEGGSLQGGHYTSNVKIGDKYFNCNDMSRPPYREISKKEFYENVNSYLVMLKKVL